MMAQIRKFFRSLHWKLTLSYTLVTLAAIVIIQVIAAIGVWYIIANSNLVTIGLISITKSFIAPSAVTYLSPKQPDIQGLRDWLESSSNADGYSFQSPVYTNVRLTIGGSGSDMVLLVLDRNLEILAWVPDLSDEYLKQIIGESNDVLAAALAGEEEPERISYISHDQSLTLAVPLIGEQGNHLGILMLRMANPFIGFFQQIISLFGISILAFTIAAGLIGAFFGFITSRGLTHRLRQVTQATDKWSRGDFSTFIQEHSQDELGQLAQRLNRMAEQLQNLLQTRQELAALEERTRLARDLHDGVKQQVFATTMQLGAAREMIDQDANAARRHINQAEQLSLQAQKELASIIRELHPATLENKGLAHAVQELVDVWSTFNKINVVTTLSDLGRLPKRIEQELFRVIQEALANIAKHSQATRVAVELCLDRDDISITIADNGTGFDIQAVEGKGVGLFSMRERIESLGGDFRLESTPGSGTRLSVRCQINKGESL